MSDIIGDIIDVLDYRGERVIFTHQKWQEKSSVHSELQDNTFLKNVRQTIEDPEIVWQDKSDKRRRCYYKKYSVATYVKVVIWIKSDPCRVVTAFETNFIKESKYLDLIQIK